MPAVEQPGEFVGSHQVFQLAHHAAQRVLVRLQGIAALAHALPHRLYVAGEQAQPDHYDEHHEHLQCSPARQLETLLQGLYQVDAGKSDERQRRTAGEDPRRQLEHAEQQGQHVEHHEGAAQAVDVIEEIGQPGDRHQHLRLGQAGIGVTQVATAGEQPEEGQLASHHQGGAGRRGGRRCAVEAAE
ncbi:Uncharacterised protein [Enterobacter cloacae]|nr:Uncharacterised protein [Enterobacter cloacae]